MSAEIDPEQLAELDELCGFLEEPPKAPPYALYNLRRKLRRAFVAVVVLGALAGAWAALLQAFGVVR